MRLCLTPVLAAALLWPAAAQASSAATIVPAPGAVNLAAGGGYLAWAAPEEDTGWRLTVLSPTGTIIQPTIRFFPGPPDAAIGLDAGQQEHPRVVYTRPYRGSEDVYVLDLETGKERRMAAVSSRCYDELTPSIDSGRLIFVRRGGKKDGVYVWDGRGAARRISRASAVQTAVSGSRVAYATSRQVVVRALSGGRRPAVSFPTTLRARSLILGARRAAWLESDGRIVRTDGFRGSSGKPRVSVATRREPAPQSIAFSDDDTVGYGLDRVNVFTFLPPLTFGADPTRGD